MERTYSSGKVKISMEAIASIADQAVQECYGVVGTTSVSAGRRLIELIRPGEGHRGVDVRIKDEQICIDLYVVIEYGTRISTVAHNLMEAVQFKVEKTLDLTVAEVNVHVRSLRVSEYD
jgi:uncharacterized alkaline shock family protein YloU